MTILQYRVYNKYMTILQAVLTHLITLKLLLITAVNWEVLGNT